MNEQLPPQSVESQIRALDGLFASSNQGNEYVIHTSIRGEEQFREAMRQSMHVFSPSSDTVRINPVAAANSVLMTPEEVTNLYFQQGVTMVSGTGGQGLNIVDGQPVWKEIRRVPAKKNFFERLTLIKDE